MAMLHLRGFSLPAIGCGKMRTLNSLSLVPPPQHRAPFGWSRLGRTAPRYDADRCATKRGVRISTGCIPRALRAELDLQGPHRDILPAPSHSVRGRGGPRGNVCRVPGGPEMQVSRPFAAAYHRTGRRMIVSDFTSIFVSIMLIQGVAEARQAL